MGSITPCEGSPNLDLWEGLPKLYYQGGVSMSGGRIFPGAGPLGFLPKETRISLNVGKFRVPIEC